MMKTPQRIAHKLMEGHKLSFCDIGGAGGLPPRWKPFSDLLDVTLFEPDQRTNTDITEKVNIIDKAVWSKDATQTFYATKKPQCSSLYRPNVSYLSKFPNAERFDVISERQLQTTTLDKALGDRRIEFLKLDIQGGEYEVLKSSAGALKNVLAIETEVEFKPLYMDQPLFWDVKTLLENQGFEFMDFLFISRWERDNLRGYGESNWADALFVRTPEYMIESYNRQDIKIETLRSYALSLFAYRRSDLLKVLDRNLPASVAKKIMLADSISYLDRRLGYLFCFRSWANGFLGRVMPQASLHIMY